LLSYQICFGGVGIKLLSRFAWTNENVINALGYFSLFLQLVKASRFLIEPCMSMHGGEQFSHWEPVDQGEVVVN